MAFNYWLSLWRSLLDGEPTEDIDADNEDGKDSGEHRKNRFSGPAIQTVF
jgi:hypothetical protein